MKALLLGTGAADYDWKNYGQDDVRGSACTLLDDHILLDCGITATKALQRFHVNPEDIDTILITHSHGDHFYPTAIREIAQASPNLTLYAPPEAIAILPESCQVRRVPLTPGKTFTCQQYQITALRANHTTTFPTERTLNYCLQSSRGNILYALDSAAMLKETFLLIRKIRFDWIFIDCYLADAGNDRIFEHSDIDMVTHLMKTFRNQHMIDDQTRIILDHIARSPWPATEEERQAKIRHTDFELAHDGMTLTFPE